MLLLDVALEGHVMVGEMKVKVVDLSKTGKVKLGFEGPASIKVLRGELLPRENPVGLLQLATDGSCPINPGGPGGWAFVIFQNDKELKRESGYIPAPSTNNRAEMTAVIQGLKHCRALYPGQKVRLLCDSTYVVNGINSRMHKQVKFNFQNVVNGDLWNIMYISCSLMEVEAVHVRGHAGNQWNELCDTMAGREVGQ